MKPMAAMAILLCFVLSGCGDDGDDDTQALSAEESQLVTDVRRFAQGPPAVGDIDRWTDASDSQIVAEAEEVCDDMARNGIPPSMEFAYRMSGGPRGTKVYELFVATKCPGLSINVEAWYSSVPKHFRLENNSDYVEYFGL